MIDTIDVARSGLKTLWLPPGDSEEKETPGCAPCAAFRPAPELSGNLRVDPEIHLPSPVMDVDIAYYYNANRPDNRLFGYG